MRPRGVPAPGRCRWRHGDVAGDAAAVTDCAVGAGPRRGGRARVGDFDGAVASLDADGLLDLLHADARPGGEPDFPGIATL